MPTSPLALHPSKAAHSNLTAPSLRGSMAEGEDALLSHQPLSAEGKQRLRASFIAQARTYRGVPYAKNNCRPEDANADLFLDCCGLIRQVLRDMAGEFGFEIGPGNQAYQFDCLPEARTLEALEPGDLVFYSGTYFNPASSQAHDITHVEIFTGGTSTIGSRSGQVVSEHATFRFPGDQCAKYHSVQYKFRSIDTWLGGVCQSFCKEHSWDEKCRKMMNLYKWARSPPSLTNAVSIAPQKHSPVRYSSHKNQTKKKCKRRAKVAADAAGTFELHDYKCHFATALKNSDDKYVVCDKPTVFPSCMFCHDHYKYQALVEQGFTLPKQSMEYKSLKQLAARKRGASKQLNRCATYRCEL